MDHPATPIFRRVILPRLVFALLLLSVVWVYAPARTRFFAKDQLFYLAELDGDRSFSAGLRLLDYSAVRQFNKGDELLYRPLLMVGLAAQNAIFKLDFRAWNAANLFAHLLAAWLLFEALWRLRRSPFAHAFALWFALLASNFELVTWNHLGGYMLGYGLLLVAIMALREAILHPDRPRVWWIYGLAIAAAMLIHEIAVIAAVIAVPFAGLLLRRHPGAPRRAAILALLAPLLLFIGLYASHVARCERWLWVDTAGTPAYSIWQLPLHMFYAGQVWITRILAPAATEYLIWPFNRSTWQTPAGAAVQVRILLQFGLWACVGLCIRKSVTRVQLKSAGLFALGLASLLFAYTAMNCWGRPIGVLDVPYYAYFFALFSTLLAYSLLDFTRPSKIGCGIALILLLALCLFNGQNILHASRQVEQIHVPIARYYDAIAKDVRPYMPDPSFTFAIQHSPRHLDPVGNLSHGYPDSGNTRMFSATKLLYGRHYDPLNPRFWVVPGAE